MSLKIAQMPQGNCSACGVLIDAGEWYDAIRLICLPCVKTCRAPAAMHRQGDSLFDDPKREFIEDVKQELGARELRFSGAVYDARRDKLRLAGQLARIFNLMADSRWRTLKEIEVATGDPQSSISAQLRHLKKSDFGAHQVDKRLRTGTATWEYKLTVNENCKAA